MNKKLKPSRKSKLERTIRENDLLNRPKKIFLYPIRTDTAYIVLKAAESYTLDSVYEKKVKEFLIKNGFKKRSGREGDFYQNEYFLSIYWGKLNQFSSKKSLKFQATGQYLIYKNAERALRDLVKDIKAIFTANNVLSDWRFTRLDVSYLILASDIYQILPKQEELIFLSNNMQPRVSFYKNSENVSAITYTNSALQLMVYDKEYEIKSRIKTHSADYLNYYAPYVAEAKKRKMKLYRLELKVSSQKSLDCFQSHFFSAGWDEDSNKNMLKEILLRFFKTHSFRRPPKNQLDLEDKRNRGRWEIDPLTKNLFTNSNLSVDLKGKRNIGFKTKMTPPKKNKSLDDIAIGLGNGVAKHDQNLQLEDFEYIKIRAYQQYLKKKYDEIISIQESVQHQTSWRLLNAQSEAEVVLIRKEHSKTLKSLEMKKMFDYQMLFKSRSEEALIRVKNKKSGSETQ